MIDNTSNIELMLNYPRKALWNMSISLIISMFITSIYNVIDAIWVAGLSADALAGVGFVTPIFIAIMGIGNGLGAGSASALSKYIGEDNKKKADNGAVHTLFISIVVALVTTIVLLISLKSILLLIGAGSTISYAISYGNIISVGSIFIILSNALYGTLRAEGDTNRTMYAMLFSAIINIILDPLFIYGLNLGVSGAAYATIISLVFVNMILFYWFYVKKNTYLKPNLSNYVFSKNISLDILKVGFPASLELINNAVFAALFSLLLTIIAGTDAVAVYSTGWRIVTFGTVPMLAIGTALVSVVGANYGSRNYENIRVVHRYSMKISIFFGVLCAVLTYVFAPQIVALFSYTGSSIRLSSSMVSFLCCIVFFYPTMAVGVNSTYLFQGVGKCLTAMFQTIFRELGFTLLFAVVFAMIFNMGEFGAWLGIVFGEFVANNITLVWADIYIRRLIQNKSL
ncbi:multidrug transporter MatE [Methanosphaera sp. WGK6]|nr:multidrug transporter MatE [Methanosphaera sp. WGK6]